MLVLFLHLLACDRPSVLDAPTPTRGERPARVEAGAIPLGRRAEAVEDLVLPASSRPGGARAPTAFGPVAPFEPAGTVDGVDLYRTPLPLHSSLLPDKLRSTHSFGSAPPDGLVVTGPGGVWTFERGGRRARSYGFDREWLYVGVRAGDPAPSHTAFFLTLPRATAYEDGLNRATFDGSDADFLARSVTLDQVSTSGLFLPAPGSATWRITVPERAVFATRVQVLRPAIRSAVHSDGATLVVELLDGERVVGRTEVRAEVGRWTDLRWELGDQAGQDRRIRLRTEPGATADFDYVFLADPTVYPASDSPRRTVLVFVDTLRPDHLGLYGHDRATTPFVDRWAAHAAVFEQARSVAPWTLPSARAALTGYQPEQYYEVPNLAERFGAAGWATEAIVANAFLSQPFDLHRGWGRFQYQHLLPADEVARAALDALARHPDRDLLLLVHFMDPHLPYEEGLWYRYRWAWRSPDGLAPARGRLYEATWEGAERDAMKRYVEARYDQNIRFVDDELRAVLEAAGPEATVALFSDHGEEFWDHDHFEHGHSLHEELLRVPLVIRSPFAPPGRYEAPVSLLDLSPTLLDLAGLEPPGGPGRSLVDLMYGAPGAAQALADRPQAFGRLLYEQDGWAVLHRGRKWIDRAGVQRVYDLAADPTERTDLAAADPALPAYPRALAQALDREVLTVWRLRPKTRKASGGVQIRLSHPDGIREAWRSYDPRGRTAAVQVAVEDGVLVIEQPPGVEMPNAFYVVPAVEGAAPAGLRLEASGFGQPHLVGESAVEALSPGPERQVLLEVGEKGWSFLVDTARVPVRAGVEVSAFHPDVAAQLEELGYVEAGEEAGG